MIRCKKCGYTGLIDVYCPQCDINIYGKEYEMLAEKRDNNTEDVIGRTKVKWHSLPVPFINEIKQHIKDNDTYRNVPDFVKQSVREKIDREKEYKTLAKPSNRGVEMEKVEFKVNGFELEQRTGELLEKGDSLNADEDLCYLLLPIEYADKNIVCILTEE